jgi:hypothetical protein
MRKFVNEPETKKLGLNIVFATRTLMTLHRGSSRFTTEKSQRGESGFWKPCDEGGEIGTNWRTADRCLREIRSFLRDDLGWCQRRWLPSANALIPIAYLLKHKGGSLSERDKEWLKQYLGIVGVRHLFHGTVETTINDYIRPIKNANKENQPVTAELLVNQIARRDKTPITPDEISAESRATSPLMQVYLAYLISIEAQSWLDGRPLSVFAKDDSNGLDVHHIFPRKLLEDNHIPTKHVNSMANYAIISHGDNDVIGPKGPMEAFSNWTPEVQQRAECQLFVNANPELLAFNAFEKYLNMRARRLAEVFNGFLGLPVR